MECRVTFHDHYGRADLESALDPMSVESLHDLIESAVAETVSASLERGVGEVEVEVTFCGDAEMTRLNFDHMGERGPTDVLAFPLHEWTFDGHHSHLADDDGIGPPGPLLLGDVLLDVDQAVRQAEEGDWSPAEELALLTIHGCLHLLGHDHAEMDEEEAMRDVERSVLAELHRQHQDVDWKPGSLFDRAGHAVTTGS
jgi:probable rRNA maturation factor